MRRSLLCLALCSVSPAAAQAAVKAADIAAILDAIADGRDPSFPGPVAPAWTLDAGRPLAERIRAVDTQIAQEIARVAAAFLTAPAAARMSAATATVAQFDPATARNGAAYTFAGSDPSLAVLRQLLFVPQRGETPSVEDVMQVSSSFVRSPKPNDVYYAYSNPSDLKNAQVAELDGSDASWTSAAQPPMENGETYALKKCRHIFILGWYCDTSLYQVRDLPGAEGQVKLLLSVLRTLPPDADNPMFADRRASNVAAGYSAIYAVIGTDDQIMAYNIGVFSRNGSLFFRSRLRAGLARQSAQLRSRLSAVLGVAAVPP